MFRCYFSCNLIKGKRAKLIYLYHFVQNELLLPTPPFMIILNSNCSCLHKYYVKGVFVIRYIGNKSL